MAYGLTKSAHLVAASSQYLTAAESASLTVAGGNFSIEGWLNFNSLPADGNRFVIASKGNLATYAGEMAFHLLNTTGTYSLNIYYSNGSSAQVTSTVNWTPTIGTWYHVAVTHDSSGNVKFYVNGVQQGATQTGSIASSANSGVAFAIGSYTTGTYSNFFNGDISLMRLWSSVRVASDFSTNQCSVLGSTTNLGAEWTLDNVLTDNSGNSNTLTNVNTATFTTTVPATCTVVANKANFLAFM